VRTHRIPLRKAFTVIRDGLVALAMPFIILGGILAGIFTPTESGAVAVIYAFFVGVCITRELKIRAMPRILLRSFVITSVIFLIVSTAGIFGYLLTIAHAPDVAANLIMSTSKSPYFFLFLSNIFFLMLGCIMEPTAGMILSVPVFSPLATIFGVDPLHFAIIVTVNLSIGCITPPIGTSLYAVATVAKRPVETVAYNLAPFLIVEIVILFLITYFPALSLTLPKFLRLH